MFDAKEFFGQFIDALDNDSQSVATWNADQFRSVRWTEIATAAVVKAIRTSAGKHRENLEIAAKGHPDRYGSSEYFTLDVTAYIDGSGAPLVTIEHENWGEDQENGDRIAYSCWKLLCVDSSLRVLICYVDPTGTHQEYKASEVELVESLQGVMQAHSGKQVALIIGKWEEVDPSAGKGWRDVYSVRMAGGATGRIRGDA
jgi:hypothetical protein